jgi:hypothetical protein
MFKLFFRLLFLGLVIQTQAMMTPREFFERLNKDTMNLVDEFYHPDVDFQDPVTSLHGPAAIKRHYLHQYTNVKSIRWEFPSEIKSGNLFSFEWIMVLSHPSLNGGKEFRVPGSSFMKMAPNGQVIYHRDYFDMGDFVYDRLPVFRWVNSFIKSKLKDH